MILRLALTLMMFVGATSAFASRYHHSYHGEGRVINSVGGELGQFHAQRQAMIANHIAPHLGTCHSACTMFLSVPGACVYPNSRLGFHQAFAGQMTAMGPVPMGADQQGTMEMWERYPEIVKRVVGWPMPMAPAMRMVSGAELIANGFPQCGR